MASGFDPGANATYGYDQLNRLTSVAGAHNQSYTYDGWGNLSSKTGDGQVFTTSVNAKNQLVGTGVSYDANGNMTSSTSGVFAYDVRSRLVTVSATMTLSAENYYYTVDNKRVSTIVANGTNKQVIYIHGAKGELGQICTKQFINSEPACDINGPTSVSFAGRIVQQNGQPTAVDRVGSVAAYTLQGTQRHYYPYGESPEPDLPFPGNIGFATYFRDPTRGLDYADHRFYNSGYGRFMSADPYINSAGTTDPGSWNRYSYASNDPVNRIDPRGLFTCDPDTGTSVTVCADVGPVYVDQSQQSPGQAGSNPNRNAPQTVGGLTFTDVGSSGVREKQIFGLLDFIKGNIDSDCNSWLIGAPDFSQSYPGGLGDVIQGLESGGQDSSGNSVPTIGFATVTGQPGFVNNANTGSGVNGLAIVVNVQGSVFSSSAPRSSGDVYNRQISSIVPRSQRAGVFVLLHELAHLLSAPGFRADNGNFQNGKLNNDDVYSNCAKTLNAASNR